MAEVDAITRILLMNIVEKVNYFVTTFYQT